MNSFNNDGGINCPTCNDQLKMNKLCNYFEDIKEYKCTKCEFSVEKIFSNNYIDNCIIIKYKNFNLNVRYANKDFYMYNKNYLYQTFSKNYLNSIFGESSDDINDLNRYVYKLIKLYENSMFE